MRAHLCREMTAPHKVIVVTAKRTESVIPKRTSLPSMLPPHWVVVTVWFAPTLESSGLPGVLCASFAIHTWLPCACTFCSTISQRTSSSSISSICAPGIVSVRFLFLTVLGRNVSMRERDHLACRNSVCFLLVSEPSAYAVEAPLQQSLHGPCSVRWMQANETQRAGNLLEETLYHLMRQQDRGSPPQKEQYPFTQHFLGEQTDTPHDLACFHGIWLHHHSNWCCLILHRF